MTPTAHSSAREVAEQIAACGGIITLPGVPLVRELVGELRWAGDGMVFWFTAFGDLPTDGHAVTFQEIRIHPVGVCFLNNGAIAAFIAPIEKSAVEDPEDYRVAWNLWQEVLPMRQKLIDEAFNRHVNAVMANALVSGLRRSSNAVDLPVELNASVR